MFAAASPGPPSSAVLGPVAICQRRRRGGLGGSFAPSTMRRHADAEVPMQLAAFWTCAWPRASFPESRQVSCLTDIIYRKLVPGIRALRLG